jgi:hypothetical protein
MKTVGGRSQIYGCALRDPVLLLVLFRCMGGMHVVQNQSGVLPRRVALPETLRLKITRPPGSRGTSGRTFLTPCG